MNKRTVADDALISTDIDNIIKYLASKKRVEMGALAQQFGMKRESIKKWIGILEDEGYVQIEYHLLNEFVVWAGEEIPAVEEPREERKDSSFFDQPSYPQKGAGAEPGKEESQEKAEPKSELPEPAHEDIKAEERVDRIMERVNQKQPKDDITDIISSFAEKEESGAKKDAKMRFMPRYSNLRQDERQKTQKDSKKDARMEKAKEEMVSLKRSLTEYIGEIRVQREELERLKAERESFIAKAYLPLEGKFKAAYDDMAGRILEKEGRIIELRERLMELPGKMDDADKLTEALRRIRDGIKGSLASNREGVDKLKKSLLSEESKISSDIDSLEAELKSRKAEMIDLSGSISSLESKEQELRKTMEGLNRQLTEVNEGISSSYAAMASFSQKRSEMAAKLDGIKADMDAKAGEVADSYSRLKDVRQAEGAIN
ncbi:MAG: hypothetical protein PHS02_00205 [Candidatus ainarchaeum sp.]|nr:hypothetical protein [Candidatus ainarchaeum sp.]